MLAVFRAEADTLIDGVARRRERARAPANLDRAAVGLVGAEQQACGFGAARTEQAGQAQQLALLHVEVDRRQHALAGEPPRVQQRLLVRRVAGCLRRHLLRRLGRRTDHLVHQGQARQRAAGVLAFALAVAHHRDAIRDRIGLVEEVGDEQDRHALTPQRTQHREQQLDLVLVQAGGGLVENQHARRDAQGAGNGHHLLDRQRIARQGFRYIDVDLQPRQQFAGFLAHPAPIDDAEAARVASDEDVLRDREIRTQVHFLVDRADPQRLRILGRARRDALAVQDDAAAVGLVDAGEDLDQRGFTCAVLAHQRVDFAGEEAQAGIGQRLHARELHVDACHLEDGHRLYWSGHERLSSDGSGIPWPRPRRGRHPR